MPEGRAPHDSVPVVPVPREGEKTGGTCRRVSGTSRKRLCAGGLCREGGRVCSTAFFRVASMCCFASSSAGGTSTCSFQVNGVSIELIHVGTFVCRRLHPISVLKPRVLRVSFIGAGLLQNSVPRSITILSHPVHPRPIRRYLKGRVRNDIRQVGGKCFLLARRWPLQKVSHPFVIGHPLEARLLYFPS